MLSRPGARSRARRRRADQPLEDLLAAADVVSLHVPLVDATRGLIGEREFGLMKRDAILVNVSRGGVVDEPAFVAALRAAGSAEPRWTSSPPAAWTRRPRS